MVFKNASVRRTMIALALVGGLSSASAAAGAGGSTEAAIGVGFVNAPYELPPQQQETILAQMQQSGVRVVRCSIPDGDKGVDFVQRVYAQA